MLGSAAGELWIKRGRLAAIADEQNAVTIGRLDPRGTMRSDMMKPRNAANQGDEDENTNEPAHKLEHDTQGDGDATG